MNLYDHMLKHAITETMTEQDGRLYIHRTQNVDAIVAANKFRQDDQPMSWGDGQVVASIPQVVVEQWRYEGFDIFNCTEDELRRRLNDPANQMWRTRLGRI